MDTASRIGSLVGERYRIKSLLGTGGMGAVYLAQHEVLQRPFALKVLRHELAEDPRLCKRFQREARAASRIQHPNIVYISDFGTTDDGSLFLVMEYIPGNNLRTELTTHGPFPIPRALKILIQVVDALECAHRVHVIHRDLKPENLLITEHRGKPDYVKILDFGVAKIMGDESLGGTVLSERGELYGTPYYMAPEQFSGEQVGPHTDLYALGILSYELVTGEVPFTGSLAELMVSHTRTAPVPPSRRRPTAGISPAFDAIVARCLAKAPRNRYASASELKAALQGLYRIATGSSSIVPRLDDTDFSSPLKQFMVVDSGFQADERTASELPAFLPGADTRGVQFERTLRDLAEGLRDEGLGSHELTVVLSRLVQSEERVYADQAEIALAEAQIEEADQTIDERAGRLRYAVLQLRQEQERLADPTVAATGPTLCGTAADPVADLGRQVQQLEARLLELERERVQRVSRLERSLDTLRASLNELEARQRRDADLLLALVLGARPSVTQLPLLQLYDKLESLRRAGRDR